MKLSAMSRVERQTEINTLIKGRHFNSERFKQLLSTFGGSYTYEQMTYTQKSIPVEAYIKYGAKVRKYKDTAYKVKLTAHGVKQKEAVAS